MLRTSLATALVALLGAAPAAAAPELVKVGDFHAPVSIASPPGDTRLFVVDQDGQVVVADGADRHVYLDLRSTTAQGSEEGLLSIAFPPDFASSRLFYVFQVRADHDALEVLEFREGDRTRALPESRRVVTSIPHTQADNHNGGDLHFGPDGALYVSVGDGGLQGDPEGDAQNLSSPLGKILRVDVASGARSVHAYGLRNPYRFSFDAQTQTMWIGDVGGSRFEEVNAFPAGAPTPRNFGWNCVEGTAPTGSCPPPAGAVGPALALDHADGYASVIGGVVVRDAQVPSLAGRYLYGDIAKDRLRSAAVDGSTLSGDRAESTLAVSQVVEVGEDACGRVYVGTIDGGQYAHAPGSVHRLQEQGAASTCTITPPVTAPPPMPAADERPCTVRITPPRRAQRLSRTRPRLRFRAVSDEPCRLRASASVRGAGWLGPSTLEVNGAQTVTFALSGRPATIRRLRRLLRRGSRHAHIKLTATDRAGNRTTVRRRVRVRR